MIDSALTLSYAPSRLVGVPMGTDLVNAGF